MSNYKKLIEIKLFGSRDLKSFSNTVEVIEKDYKKSYSKKVIPPLLKWMNYTKHSKINKILDNPYFLYLHLANKRPWGGGI